MSMTEPLSPFGFERDNVAKIEKAQDLSPTETGVIGNGDFTSQLDKLRRLRNFIVSQSIKDAAKDPATGQAAAISLGELNSIRYGEHGRQPSDSEWDELNEKLQYFYSLLSETDRRKFNFKLAVPMLKAIPAALVFGSIFFLIIPNVVAAFAGIEQLPREWWVSKAAFLGWIVLVGALGSIAFILVNALGIQVDPTVDVTDRDSTTFRVLLGALFSVILTLPFGYPTFEKFLKSLVARFNQFERI